MKNNIKKLGVLCCVALILTLPVFLSLQTIFSGGIVFLISFVALLHIILAAFYIVEQGNLALKIIYLFSGWGLFCLNFKDYDVGEAIGQIIFIPLILYVDGICFVFSVVIAVIISPVAYIVHCFKKTVKIDAK